MVEFKLISHTIQIKTFNKFTLRITNKRSLFLFCVYNFLGCRCDLQFWTHAYISKFFLSAPYASNALTDLQLNYVIHMTWFLIGAQQPIGRRQPISGCNVRRTQCPNHQTEPPTDAIFDRCATADPVVSIWFQHTLSNRTTDPNCTLQSRRNIWSVHHSWTGDVNAIPDRFINCTTANANRIRVAFTVLSYWWLMFGFPVKSAGSIANNRC